MPRCPFGALQRPFTKFDAPRPPTAPFVEGHALASNQVTPSSCPPTAAAMPALNCHVPFERVQGPRRFFFLDWTAPVSGWPGRQGPGVVAEATCPMSNIVVHFVCDLRQRGSRITDPTSACVWEGGVLNK